MKQPLRNMVPPGAARLNVLVVYENLRLAIEALGLCDRLADQLAPAFELQTDFWSVSALELPVLVRAAQAEAGQTDVLIVAVESATPLSTPFQVWLRRWARRPQSHRSVLAARLHGLLKMDRGFSPAFACLQQIAAEAGVDFLWEAVGSTSESSGDEAMGCVNCDPLATDAV
jgi:hypothetical protein